MLTLRPITREDVAGTSAGETGADALVAARGVAVDEDCEETPADGGGVEEDDNANWRGDVLDAIDGDSSQRSYNVTTYTMTI